MYNIILSNAKECTYTLYINNYLGMYISKHILPNLN